MNVYVATGNLAADPVSKTTDNGKQVVNFRIGIRKWKKGPDGKNLTLWLNCVAWNQTANFVASYLTKGSKVAISGELDIREVIGQDGAKRYFTEVICNQVESIGPAPEHKDEPAHTDEGVSADTEVEEPDPFADE